MSNLLKLTQNQTRDAIEVAMCANTPVMITGKAGSGKSEIIKQLCDKHNLHLVDLRLSQLMSYDLN